MTIVRTATPSSKPRLNACGWTAICLDRQQRAISRRARIGRSSPGKVHPFSNAKALHRAMCREQVKKGLINLASGAWGTGENNSMKANMIAGYRLN